MKSKWFRLIFVICILSAFSLILFGCQKDPDGPDNPNPDNPNTPEGHVHEYNTWDFDETGHWKVCECGAKDPDSESDHHLGGWRVTKAANCAEEGTRERSCECGFKEEATIAVNPDNHVWDTEHPIVKIAPTCQTPGSGQYKCKNNESHISGDVELPIDPNAHNFGENWSTRTESTCLKHGIEENPCQNPGCTEFEIRELPLLEHEWDDNWYTDQYDAIPATCHHTGIKVRYCTRGCGTKDEAQTEIDPNNHEYSNTYINIDNFEHKQEPTCGCPNAQVKISRHDYKANGAKVTCSLCTFEGTSHSNDARLTYGDDNGVINIKPNAAGDLLVIIPALANNKAVTVLGPGEVGVKDESGGETNTYGLFKDENNFATNVRVKDIVIPYTIMKAKEGTFAIIPNLLADVGYLYFEGTPNQFDTIDLSNSGWFDVNGGEVQSWTRTLAFYSDKNPSTLTDEERTAMGVTQNVHKNFHLTWGTEFEYKFWHWDTTGTNPVPKMWDVVVSDSSSEGEADPDKGKHATEESDFVFVTKAVTPSSLDRRVLGVNLKAINKDYTNGTTLVLPRSLNYNGYGQFPLKEIDKWCFNPDKRKESYDTSEDDETDWLTYSVKSIVIPDTITRIGIEAFDNNLETVYYEGSLDSWVKLSSGFYINDEKLKSIANSGDKFYIYSSTTPTDEQKKLGLDGKEATNGKTVKYWHWTKGSGEDEYKPTLWDENGTAETDA